MAAIRTIGLVLRSVEVFETSSVVTLFTRDLVFETSSVVTLFTRDLGKVSGLAKGARRLKSPFRAGLDLLSVCDIVLLHKASEALDLLTEASAAERFDSLRRDLAALHAGYYIAELLHDLTDFHDPHPKLLDAALVTLRSLGDSGLRPRRVLRFELACLRELGLMPALESCVHCGAVVDAAGGTEVAFSLSGGGVLCPACRPGQPHVTTLSGLVLGAIQSLASPGNAWRDPDWDSQTLATVRGTVGSVICHVLGRRPRLLPFLGA